MSFLNHLQGKILDVSSNFLILSLNRISFRIRISEKLFSEIKNRIGEDVILYISEILDERGINFFGFLEKEKRDFFEELLNLSGVGVRLALKIVDNITLEEWKDALEKDNWEILTTVPGIGKRLAQKIFFSAKRVLPKEEREEEINVIIEALYKLGYSKKEVEKVIKDLSREKEKTPEELLKMALERLKKE
ncbi:MAG: Holliday junction branch migration protein RuvA [Dictyoglomaceae bacterium]